jgi:hypothetical protein
MTHTLWSTLFTHGKGSVSSGRCGASWSRGRPLQPYSKCTSQHLSFVSLPACFAIYIAIQQLSHQGHMMSPCISPKTSQISQFGLSISSSSKCYTHKNVLIICVQSSRQSLWGGIVLSVEHPTLTCLCKYFIYSIIIITMDYFFWQDNKHITSPSLGSTTTRQCSQKKRTH